MSEGSTLLSIKRSFVCVSARVFGIRAAALVLTRELNFRGRKVKFKIVHNSSAASEQYRK